VRFAHYDGRSGYDEQRQAYYSTYSTRSGRCAAAGAALGLLDVTAGVFSQVTTEDNVAPTPAEGGGPRGDLDERHDAGTTIQIGAGTAAPEDVILRRVTVRARESKFA
jgi:hypothetical protein